MIIKKQIYTNNFPCISAFLSSINSHRRLSLPENELLLHDVAESEKYKFRHKLCDGKRQIERVF